MLSTENIIDFHIRFRNEKSKKLLLNKLKDLKAEKKSGKFRLSHDFYIYCIEQILGVPVIN